MWGWFTRQIQDAERFCTIEYGNRLIRQEFGRLWTGFASKIDSQRIALAEKSLISLFTDTVRGKTFLDVGCGSGLFSLAAVRLGATVTAFDNDAKAVQCAKSLRQMMQCSGWQIEYGSILDNSFVQSLQSLPTFDVVYCWGCVHYTGRMWRAMESLIPFCKKDGGILILAVFNDQGWRSNVWRVIKRLYSGCPISLRPGIWLPCFLRLWGPTILKDAVHGNPFHSLRTYKYSRGMDAMTDLSMWLSGYPFEVAKPDDVIDFYRNRGFRLLKSELAGKGMGNNVFVFERS